MLIHRSRRIEIVDVNPDEYTGRYIVKVDGVPIPDLKRFTISISNVKGETSTYSAEQEMMHLYTE